MTNKVNSGMAIASFVLGLISVFIGWIPFAGQIPSILAIVFGFVALNNIKKNKNLEGKSLAIWGICLGAFWLVMGVILIFIGIGWYTMMSTLIHSSPSMDEDQINQSHFFQNCEDKGLIKMDSANICEGDISYTGGEKCCNGTVS